LAANSQGEVFFSDVTQHCIRKLGLDGRVTVFVQHAGAARGLAFGPDGRLYATLDKKKILSFDPKGKADTIVHGFDAQAICAGHNGNIYATDPTNKRIWLLDGKGKKKIVDTGMAFAGGLCLAPDQSLLMAADQRGQFVYSFHINPDGTLADRQAYHHLRIPDAVMESGADGMTVDRSGILYVVTHLGIQMCDQAGRVEGILSAPPGAALSDIAFGGPGLDEIYATTRDGRIFKRKLRAAGVLSFQPPIKPAPLSL
jgi:sugar lactone lactonase YvrE